MSFGFFRAPPDPGPQGVTLGAGRHPSPLSRRRSVLIRMEAGPAVQPGERRGGEVGRFLARLQQRVRRTQWLRDHAGRAVVSHANEVRARS